MEGEKKGNIPLEEDAEHTHTHTHTHTHILTRNKLPHCVTTKRSLQHVVE